MKAKITKAIRKQLKEIASYIPPIKEIVMPVTQKVVKMTKEGQVLKWETQNEVRPISHEKGVMRAYQEGGFDSVLEYHKKVMITYNKIKKAAKLPDHDLQNFNKKLSQVQQRH